MKPTPQIKQRIQELVPDIMELKFGCHFYFKNGVKDCVVINLSDKNIDFAVKFPLLDWKIDKLLKWKGFEDDIVILGRPLTLADVLRAIPIGVYMKSLGEQVRFLTYDDKDIEKVGLEYWDLTTDFDGQSDECKQFIGELLGVNK